MRRLIILLLLVAVSLAHAREFQAPGNFLLQLDDVVLSGNTSFTLREISPGKAKFEVNSGSFRQIAYVNQGQPYTLFELSITITQLQAAKARITARVVASSPTPEATESINPSPAASPSQGIEETQNTTDTETPSNTPTDLPDNNPVEITPANVPSEKSPVLACFPLAETSLKTTKNTKVEDTGTGFKKTVEIVVSNDGDATASNLEVREALAQEVNDFTPQPEKTTASYVEWLFSLAPKEQKTFTITSLSPNPPVILETEPIIQAKPVAKDQEQNWMWLAVAVLFTVIAAEVYLYWKKKKKQQEENLEVSG